MAAGSLLLSTRQPPKSSWASTTKLPTMFAIVWESVAAPMHMQTAAAQRLLSMMMSTNHHMRGGLVPQPDHAVRGAEEEDRDHAEEDHVEHHHRREVAPRGVRRAAHLVQEEAALGDPDRQGAQRHEAEEEEDEEQGPETVLDARGVVPLVAVEEAHRKGRHQVEHEVQDDKERVSLDLAKEPQGEHAELPPETRASPAGPRPQPGGPAPSTRLLSLPDPTADWMLCSLLHWADVRYPSTSLSTSDLGALMTRSST